MIKIVNLHSLQILATKHKVHNTAGATTFHRHHTRSPHVSACTNNDRQSYSKT